MGPGEPDINGREHREYIGLDEKAARHSRASRNTPNKTETTVMPPPSTGPYFTITKMMQTMLRIMM